MRKLLALMLVAPFILSLGCGSGGSGEADGTPPVVLFSIDNGTDGDELAVTDGTATNTFRVKDIYPGANGSGPSTPDNYVILNAIAYFSANDGTNGNELWRSDGTEAGTYMVKDIRPGANSSNVSNITIVNNTIYFAADDGTNGYELWKSDGTEAGTVLVKDINAGGIDSYPSSFAAYGKLLIFQALENSTGYELWKSDGTEAGTVLVKDIAPGAGGPGPGIDLGTPVVGESKDVIFSSSSYPRYFVPYKGFMYFAADDGTNGRELWRTDGTETGTQLVMDVRPGALSSGASSLTVAGSTLYFTGTNAALPTGPPAKALGGGEQLWKSDGTAAGTVLLYTFAEFIPGLTAFNDEVFFSGNDGVHDFELWKSNGTAAGTFMVKDIKPDTVKRVMDGGSPEFLTVANGLLFFVATDSDDDRELWRSDGTEAGTQRVKDINTDAPSDIWGLHALDNPEDIFHLFKKGVVFGADDGTHGVEPWFSDGSESGTYMLGDFNAGNNDSWSSGPR